MPHGNSTSDIRAFKSDHERAPESSGSQITCPSCGEEISLTEALRSQFTEKFEKEYKQRAHVAAALIQQKEALLMKKAQLLDKQYLEKLAAERIVVEKRLKEEFEKNRNVEIEDLRKQIEEKTKKVDEAIQLELEFRKKARVLEEREKVMELELIKKWDVEKVRLEEQISKKLSEDQRFKIAEKDKQLDDMRTKIEELKRKSELTSQQLQGEVLELELETMLKKFCLIDIVEPVAKGVRGGDIIHKVMTQQGIHVGTIVWEAKRTKAWSDGWIDKIKEDQRAISAECAVIVSDVLPKGISGLQIYEGVWVCDTKTALGLATSLRFYLVQVHAAKQAASGKDAKMEIIYRYLTGTQFTQRIQAMVETFQDMQDGLNVEKKAYQKIWAQRETQIEKMVMNTASVYGSVQGIVGGALPRIDALELARGLGDGGDAA